jgi:ubiquinone/menaquinone biosynthesis C-methylase UbiE
MKKKDLSKYGQYKNDIFNKLDVDFKKGNNILDVGCGEGSDAEIFINEYGLDVYGIDIYEHNNVKNITGLKFKKGEIYNIPFQDCVFDYVFLHDVLHHIDEENQSHDKHIEGLKELDRVLKIGGNIIIVEGNRYNPLFYPHMVKMRRHNHWMQSYFIKTVKEVFNNEKYETRFQFFESHLYPQKFIRFWKLYEFFMEKFASNNFLAYNIAFIKKIIL